MSLPTKQRAKPLARSNAQAGGVLVVPVALGAALWFSQDAGPIPYVLGQLAGALFFTQAFILVHEFGHRSMFTSTRVNTWLGHLFSIPAFVPLHNWVAVHELHHKWTGYRDLDPTTESTFAESLSPMQKWLVDFSWRFYIPLISAAYRFGIFWNPARLKRHLSIRSYRRALVSMALSLGVYIALVWGAPLLVLRLLPAIYLSFVICGTVSLSQHSHISMKLAAGESVRPMRFADQVQYTRSIELPTWIGRLLLLNFNHHEAHHAHPGAPCYRLHLVDVERQNSYPLGPWLKTVKAMGGVDFIFRSDPGRTDF